MYADTKKAVARDLKENNIRIFTILFITFFPQFAIEKQNNSICYKTDEGKVLELESIFSYISQEAKHR